MVDGFWTAVFKGGAGQEHGVVVFTKGKIFGGDSVYTYIGNYESEAEIKGQIGVPKWPAIGDTFVVNNVISGKPVKFHGEVIRLIKHPPEQPTLDGIMVVKVGPIQQVRPASV